MELDLIMEELEYNILGSKIKVKPEEDVNSHATQAIKLVNDEIENLKKSNRNLKDIDVAVLVSLKMAAKSLEFEDEFKDTLGFFKNGMSEALQFVESASSSES